MTATLDDLRQTIRSLTDAEERRVVGQLLAQLQWPEHTRAAALCQARAFVAQARARKRERTVLEVFLQEFGLSTQEGIALLCLAEALLRVPDADTADRLIAEKIRSGDWAQHRSRSDAWLVNAATSMLTLTAGIVQTDTERSNPIDRGFNVPFGRLGEPVVRAAVRRAMRIVGNEFVLGRTIEEALGRTRKSAETLPLVSFDMLGEGARTNADAGRHFQLYIDAIRAVAADNARGVYAGHGVSIKLSALHPRYEYAQRSRVVTELLFHLKLLAIEARDGNLHLTIDAEEASRLELSLELIEALARSPELAGWQGLGVAVQCSSKRATAVMEWLIALGRKLGRRFLIRLVKGAYWDTEIKRAQELGLRDYPVFTRKVSTDLSYLVCARKALSNPDVVYPQFATHNAHTIAAILAMSGAQRDFEFQRLHGMGELLYATVQQQVPDLPPVRVYAPVGAHEDLLAYLVRRLLENGANTSFVNRYMDEKLPLDELIQDPFTQVRALRSIAHPRIPLPTHIYGAARRNSTGLDLSNPADVEPVLRALASMEGIAWQGHPLVNGKRSDGKHLAIQNPARRADLVGYVIESSPADIEQALSSAVAAQPAWDRNGADARAAILERAADALEAECNQFFSLLIREAGKTLGDAVAEVREAVDFCRYYALQARKDFGAPVFLASPTGESNAYSLHGRGVFICISPWNFPLAIFIGQVAAALAAGNSVIAKPAEQTPLIAAASVDLLHRSGVPADVLHLLPGKGATIGAALVADERIAGVAMTGSTATARLIASQLAERRGAIVPLIAETGGQNAMFVDSTALPEQLIDDVVRSAFHSAGQRCSALRVLYVQDDIAGAVITMLKGAMDELRLGDPARLSTDVGPVIDEPARAQLFAHIEKLKAQGRLLHAVQCGGDCATGTFVGPHLFSIDSVRMLQQEHFGPILHLVCYRAEEIDVHLAELRATGYGLTLGVHSRIHAMVRRIVDAVPAGNAYVNRNMVGAVVGVQPFGGHGLSGTGPKAGGPLYLHRFATERTLTINTAATGGNAALLCMDDE